MNRTSVLLTITLAGSLALASGEPAANAPAAPPAPVAAPAAPAPPAIGSANLQTDLQGLNASLSTLLERYEMPSPGLDLAAVKAHLSTLGYDFVHLGANLADNAKWASTASDQPTITADLAKLTADLAPAPAADLVALAKRSARAGPVLSADFTALGTNLVALQTALAAPSINWNTAENATAKNGPPVANSVTNLGNELFILAAHLNVPISENLARSRNMPTNFIPYLAVLSSGARFKGTYNVHVTNSPAGPEGYLNNSGDNTVGFLEFDYISRYVFRQPSEEDHGYRGNWLGAEWVNPLKCTPDIEARIGFTFANSTGPSNYTASTMVGSGDFYTATRVGIPLLRRTTRTQRQQVTLEGAGGVSTDSNFLEVHPSAFVGLGYQTSFTPFLGGSSTNNLCGFLSGRFGAGWVDVPATTTSPTPGVTGIQLDSGGLPVFHLDPSPCMGVSLVYPITSQLLLFVDADAYIRHAPADWTVSVGLSIPLGKVSSIITSPFTTSSN